MDVAREHHRFMERTERGERALSALAACLRARLPPPPGVYVHFPEGKELVHEIRYYFRPLGLRQPPLDPQRLERRLRHPAVLSPALVAISEWPELARRLASWPPEERASLGIVGMPRYDLYLVLPGRFAPCAGAATQRPRVTLSPPPHRRPSMALAIPAFRAIFESAPIGIVVVDGDLRIVDANAAYCRMLEYTKDELLALRIPALTHPEDRQRDVEFVPPLLAGQIPSYHAHKRYLTKTGKVVWASLTALALRQPDSEPLAFGMVEDITERKTLRGLLPVCPSCKKVRDDKGYWNQVEVYLRDHASVDVDSSLCPDCARSRTVPQS
jgi:PAS domain S-box-containing protein